MEFLIKNIGDVERDVKVRVLEDRDIAMINQNLQEINPRVSGAASNVDIVPIGEIDGMTTFSKTLHTTLKPQPFTNSIFHKFGQQPGLFNIPSNSTTTYNVYSVAGNNYVGNINDCLIAFLTPNTDTRYPDIEFVCQYINLSAYPVVIRSDEFTLVAGDNNFEIINNPLATKEANGASVDGAGNSVTNYKLSYTLPSYLDQPAGYNPNYNFEALVPVSFAYLQLNQFYYISWLNDLDKLFILNINGEDVKFSKISGGANYDGLTLVNKGSGFTLEGEIGKTYNVTIYNRYRLPFSCLESARFATAPGIMFMLDEVNSSPNEDDKTFWSDWKKHCYSDGVDGFYSMGFVLKPKPPVLMSFSVST